MTWKDCKKNQIWDGDKKVCVRANEKYKQIGDGKLPNRYWLSIGEDFLVPQKASDGTTVFDWASDVKDIPTKSKTLAVFNKYYEAKDFLYNEYILMAIDGNEKGDNEEVAGMFPRIATIEDRLSGQIYEYVLREVTEVRATEHEDIKFTKEEMQKKGHGFI